MNLRINAILYVSIFNGLFLLIHKRKYKLNLRIQYEYNKCKFLIKYKPDTKESPNAFNIIIFKYHMII